MSKVIRTVLVLWAGIATTATTAAGQADPADGVHEMLDRVEQAWDRRDIKAYESLCCREGVLAIDRASGGGNVWVGTRKDLLSALAGFWRHARVTSHRLVRRDIVVRGDTAWMQLAVANRFASRRYGLAEIIEAAVRRDGTWRMCFSMPRFVRMVTLVTGVEPASEFLDDLRAGSPLN